MLLAAANAANAPVRVTSTLEMYYFGAMAIFALLVTWAWLYLRTRARRVESPQTESPPSAESK